MKLSTDNPDTMPITDSVYGNTPSGQGRGKVYEPRGHTVKLWRRITTSDLDGLAGAFPKARRFAARRKQEDR